VNAASLETSARLQAVLDFLANRPDGATSMEIIKACNVVAPATVVSEIRHQGHRIDCKREGRHWRYKVIA
jgi:hypothetical protein